MTPAMLLLLLAAQHHPTILPPPDSPAAVMVLRVVFACYAAVSAMVAVLLVTMAWDQITGRWVSLWWGFPAGLVGFAIGFWVTAA